MAKFLDSATDRDALWDDIFGEPEEKEESDFLSSGYAREKEAPQLAQQELPSRDQIWDEIFRSDTGPQGPWEEAAPQEEWEKDPGILGRAQNLGRDVGSLLVAGTAGVAEGATWLAEKSHLSLLPGAKEAFRKAGEDAAGIREGALDFMTEKGKETATDSIFKPLSEGGVNFDTLLYKAIESAPSMAGSMGIGALSRAALGKLMAQGAGALPKAKALRAAAQAGDEYAAKTLHYWRKAGDTAASVLGFGAGEASIAAGMAGAEMERTIRESDPEELYRNFPRFRDLVDSADGAEDAYQYALDIWAEEAALEVAGNVAVSTFALGGAVGPIWGKLLPGGIKSKAGDLLADAGRLKRTGIGAAAEAAQETGQSGFEQFFANLGVKKYQDPDQDLSEGVFTAMVEGGAVGGVLGGGMALAFSKNAAVEEDVPDNVLIEAADVMLAMREKGVTQDQARQLLRWKMVSGSTIAEMTNEGRVLVENGTLSDRVVGALEGDFENGHLTEQAFVRDGWLEEEGTVVARIQTDEPVETLDALFDAGAVGYLMKDGSIAIPARNEKALREYLDVREVPYKISKPSLGASGIEFDSKPDVAPKPKGETRVAGFDIKIETPAGETRTGPGWRRKMRHSYGELQGTQGADGDPVDVFLGPKAEDPNAPAVVINQMKEDGTFDEHKVVLGYDSVEDAKKAYLSEYPPGWSRLGSAVELNNDQLREWLIVGDKKSPLSPMAMRKPVQVEGATPIDPIEYRAREVEQIAEETGADPDALKERLVKREEDPVTGFWKSDVQKPTIKRAQQRVKETGTPHRFFSLDLFNLGGLNKKLGEVKADEVMRDMVVAARDIVGRAASGATVDVRHGGDEFSFIVEGMDETVAAQVEKEIEAAARQIAEDSGVSDIPHSKRPDDPNLRYRPGSGLYVGSSPITADGDINDIRNLADAVVQRKKQENVYRVDGEATAEAQSEQRQGPQETSASLAEKGERTQGQTESDFRARVREIAQEQSKKARKGLTYGEVRLLTRKLEEKWAANKPAVVVRTVSDLPSRFKGAIASLGKGVSPIAFYDKTTDTSYIIADKIKSAEHLQKTLIEESIMHRGLSLTFGKELDDFLDKVVESIGIDKIQREVGPLYSHLDPQAPRGRRSLANEWLANQGLETEPKLWTRLVAVVNKALRSLGFDIQYTQAELRDMMQRMSSIMRSGLGRLDGGVPSPTDAISFDGKLTRWRELSDGSVLEETIDGDQVSLSVEEASATGRYRSSMSPEGVFHVLEITEMDPAMQGAVSEYVKRSGYDYLAYEGLPDAETVELIDLDGVREVPAVETDQLMFALELAQSEISTAAGTAKKKNLGKPVDVTLDGVPTNSESLTKVASKIRDYGVMRRNKTNDSNDRALIRNTQELIKQNLRFLYESLPEHLRERASKWYDGANRVANAWSARYGISTEQASAVIAALSPENDWFNNMSNAERLLDIYFADVELPYSQEMDAFFSEKLEAARKAATTPKKMRGFESFEALVENIRGKSLAELDDPLEMAHWIRAYDKSHQDQKLRAWSPEGAALDFIKTAKGAYASNSWGYMNPIASAVSILQDGSFENISRRLGSGHKIRSFYNNIVMPDRGIDVTVDTHAVAAGFMMPLSGSTAQVQDVLQDGPKENGMNTIYAMVADAYRDVAEEYGILPRQLQSITWEQARRLFANKSNKRKAAVADIWKRYTNKTQTVEKTHERIEKLVGELEPFTWESVEPDGGMAPEAGASSYESRLGNAARNDRAAATGAGGDLAVGSSGDPELESQLGTLYRLEPQEDSITVEVAHWGRVPWLDELSTDFFGTAAAGMERARIFGGRLAQRLNFYEMKDGKIPEPEPEVKQKAGAIYKATIDNIYDLGADPKKIGHLKGDELEEKVLDLGYAGYRLPKFYKGQAAIVAFKPVPVTMLKAIPFGDTGKLPAFGDPMLTFETIPSTTLSMLGSHLSELPQDYLREFTRLTIIASEGYGPSGLAKDLGLTPSIATRSFGAYAGGVWPNVLLDGFNADQANLMAAALTRMYRQDAVPWFHAHWDPGPDRMPGVLAKTPYPLSRADLEKVVEVMDGILGKGNGGFTKVGPDELALVDYDGLENWDQAIDAVLETLGAEGATFYAEGAYVTAKAADEILAGAEERSPNIREVLDRRGRDFEQRANGYARRLVEIYENLAKNPEGPPVRLGDVSYPRRQILRDLKDFYPAEVARQREMVESQDPLFSLAIEESPEFEEWFGKSQAVDEWGDPRVVYHGSSEDIEVFDFDQAGTNVGTDSKAMYFTSSPSVANQYAEYGSEKIQLHVFTGALPTDPAKAEEFRAIVEEAFVKQQIGDQDVWTAILDKEVVTEEDLAEHASKMPFETLAAYVDADSLTASGGVIYPVYLKMENPAIIRFDGDQWNDSVDAMVEDARRRGFDGVIFEGISDTIYGNVESDVYVVFSPDQIKSAVGNKTFNPDDFRIQFSLAESGEEQGQPLLRLEETINKAVKPSINPDGLRGRIRERLAGLAAYSFSDREWQIRQAIVDTGASVQRLEQEALGGLADASQSAYKMYGLAQNTPAVMQAVFKHGVPIYEDGSFTFDPNRKGLIEIFRPLFSDKKKLQEWEAYAYAYRAQRLITERRTVRGEEVSRERRLSQEEIDELLTLNDKYDGEFQRVMDEWQNFNSQLLEFAVQRGVMTAEMAEKWMTNDYVPFYRAIEDLENQHISGGPVSFEKKGLDGQSISSRRLRGSDARADSIFDNLILNTAKVLDTIYKNEAMRRIVALAEGSAMNRLPITFRPIEVTNSQIASALAASGMVVGTPPEYVRKRGANAIDEWRREKGLKMVDQMSPREREAYAKIFLPHAPQGPNVVSVYENGQPRYYEVTDAALLESIKVVGPTQMAGFLGKLFRSPKHWLTEMVTNDPGFMAANWFRDYLSTNVLTDAYHEPASAFAAAVGSLGDIWEDGDLMSRLQAAGAGAAGFYNLNSDNVAEQFQREVAPNMLSFGHWYRLWRRVGRLSEMSNRAAVAQAVLARGGSYAEAAWQAQDVLNFSQHGAAKGIRMLTETVPFMNARLQGLYKIYRAAKGETSIGQRDAARLALLMKGAMMTGMVMMLYAFHYTDDENEERYERLTDHDRDTNFHFWIDGEHFRLPKPFEIGFIFGTIPERAMRLMSERDSPTDFSKSMIRNIGETLAFNPVPQLAKPLIEQWANKSMFTGNPIVNMSISGLAPEAQYYPWTSETARAWSAIMAEAMPDTIENITPLWMRSPARIEAMVRSVFGTTGGYILNAADVLTREVTGMPDRPSGNLGDWGVLQVLQAPVEGAVGRFYRGDVERSNRYQQELYDAISKSNSLFRTYNSYIRQGRQEEAGRMLQAEPTYFAYRKYLNGLQAQLRTLNERERAIRYSDMDPQSKRVAIDQLNVVRNQILGGAAPMLDRL